MLLKYIFVCFLSRVQLVHLCKLEMMRGKEGLWITERGLYVTEVKNKMLSFQPEGRKIAYTYFQNNTLKKKTNQCFLSPFYLLSLFSSVLPLKRKYMRPTNATVLPWLTSLFAAVPIHVLSSFWKSCCWWCLSRWIEQAACQTTLVFRHQNVALSSRRPVGNRFFEPDWLLPDEWCIGIVVVEITADLCLYQLISLCVS